MGLYCGWHAWNVEVLGRNRRITMNTKQTILLLASGVLLIGSAAQSRANVEGGVSFGLEDLTDRAENLINVLTEEAAVNETDAQTSNIGGFLAMIRQAEGTAAAGDPYRVCFGYGWTVQDMSDHPAITGEWRGQRLSDAMCANAGFGPGCVSTAAGAYQIIKPTWVRLRDTLGLPDFGPYSQDSAAIELIRRRGALEDVKAGRIEQAIGKCRNEWASLPGNFAKQGQRSMGTLLGWYENNGGTFA